MEGEFGAAAAEVEHRAGQDGHAVDAGLAGHREDRVLEVGLQREARLGAGGEGEVGADDRGVRGARRGGAVEGAQDHGGREAGGGGPGQVGVVLEVGFDVPVGVGEGDPELGAVQEAGVRPGALLGVGDRPAGGHQAQFARADGLETAGGVAVQHLALVEPADGLEPHVGVGRDLHAGLVGDVVGPVVVDEDPGADHPPAQVREQAADLGRFTELDAAGAEEFPYRLGGDEPASAADGRDGLAIEIAHAAQPIPVRRPWGVTLRRSPGKSGATRKS